MHDKLAYLFYVRQDTLVGDALTKDNIQLIVGILDAEKWGTENIYPLSNDLLSETLKYPIY